MTSPLVPVSWGEFYDKISILEIKAARIAEPEKLANVDRELTALLACASTQPTFPELADLRLHLRRVNEMLWDIEDRIREKEHEQAFDADFVELARSVYHRNDERAKIKRQINELLQSGLIEEKSYRAY
jgi:hypothetical protein